MQDPFRKHSSIGATTVVAFLLILAFMGSPVYGDSLRKGHDEKISSNSNNNINNNNNESCLNQSTHPDRMTSFPGWDQPLPSAWYSGCEYFIFHSSHQ